MTVSKSVDTGVRAKKAEVELADVSFEYDGEKFTFPHPKLWPLEALEAQEDGRYAGVIRELLGEEQYKRFKSKPRTVTDLNELLEASFAAVDVDSGK